MPRDMAFVRGDNPQFTSDSMARINGSAARSETSRTPQPGPKRASMACVSAATSQNAANARSAATASPFQM